MTSSSSLPPPSKTTHPSVSDVQSKDASLSTKPSFLVSTTNNANNHNGCPSPKSVKPSLLDEKGIVRTTTDMDGIRPPPPPPPPEHSSVFEPSTPTDSSSEPKKRSRSAPTITTNTTNTTNTTSTNTTNDTPNPPKAKKSKRTKTKNIHPQILLLRRTLQQCCANGDLSTAMQTYHDMHVRDGVKMEPQSFYNLLNLCEGSIGTAPPPPPSSSSHGTPTTTHNGSTTHVSYGSATDGQQVPKPRLHIGTPRFPKPKQKQKQKQFETLSITNSTKQTTETTQRNLSPLVVTVTDTQRRIHAFDLKTKMDQLGYFLNETAYTALIRILCRTTTTTNNNNTTNSNTNNNHHHKSSTNTNATEKNNHDLSEATAFLTEAHNSTRCKPRLRTYSALLTAHAERGNLLGALNVWELVGKVEGVRDGNGMVVSRRNLNGDGSEDGGGGGGGGGGGLAIGEKEYCSLLRCALENKDGGVFRCVLSCLAEDVLVPSLETTGVIRSWFERCHSEVVRDGGSESVLDKVVNLPTGNPPLIGPDYGSHLSLSSCSSITSGCQSSSSSTTTTTATTTTTSVPIDTKTGILLSGCLQNSKLQPLRLTDESWREMIETNQTIVLEGQTEEHGRTTEFAGGGKGRKRYVGGEDGPEREKERRERKWKEFLEFLERECGPCACTEEVTGGIDGDGGDTTSMIMEKSVECSNAHDDTMMSVPPLSEPKETPSPPTSTTTKIKFDVVIDGANIGYYKQNFQNAPKHVDYRQIDWVLRHLSTIHKRPLLVLHRRHFFSHVVPSYAIPIIRRWEEERMLYKSPPGCNDDWFWMHAALWCGRGTMVVSNDEMRDHHFQRMAKRSFARWKERHRVGFDIGGWCDGGGECGSDGSNGIGDGRRRREVLLSYPSVYSRRIQNIGDYGLVVPLPKKGDTNRFLDGCHVAEEAGAPHEETYLCVRYRGA